MTINEKLAMRRRYVRAAFVMMCCIPVAALCMLALGVDPSPAAGIFGTSAATFSALIVAHFATAPQETQNENR